MTRQAFVEVHPPTWKLRLFATLVILAVGFGAAKAYSVVQGPIEGELAIGQLSEDPTENAIGRGVAQIDIPGTVRTVSLVLAGLIWVPFAFQAVRYYSAEKIGDDPNRPRG